MIELLTADTEVMQFTADGTVELQAHDGQPPQFTMLAYSGGVMRPKGATSDVVVDLAGLHVPEQSIPSFVNHDVERRVGHTTRVTNDGSRLTAEGLMSATGPHAEEVRSSAANGFPWRSSIGAQIHETERIAAGRTVRVNGRAFRGPITVVRRATLKEISFVSIPGDPSANATITGESEMTFGEWLQANGFGDEASLTSGQRTVLHASFESSQQTVDPEGEQSRLLRIHMACSGEWGSHAAEVRLLQAQATSGELTPDELDARLGTIHNRMQRDSLAAMRDARPAAGLPAGSGGNHGERGGAALEAALCLNLGIPEEIAARGHDERTMNVATSGEYRGVGLQSVFHEVIRAAGRSPSRGFSNETIRAAFEASSMLTASGFSTVSLPGILGNVANKAMLMMYESVDTVWRSFCWVGSNNDFKPHSRYRLTADGRFTKVGSDGELKHISLQEEEFDSQLDTYGAMIALTRQMIINDDANAFTQLPRAIGKLAAIQVERAVFELLLSNPNSFFSAGNKNLQSGAGSALSIGGITLAETAFQNQVDDNGDPLLVSPSVLLVPTTLSVTARSIVRDQQVEVVQAQPGNTGTNDSTTTPNGNPHAGRFDLQVSPYLNNTDLKGSDGNPLTGQSDDHWYMSVPGTSDVAPFVVSFLNGRRVPIIESGETSFNTLGVQWRGFHDFAVSPGDKRGAQRNVGS